MPSCVAYISINLSVVSYGQRTGPGRTNLDVTEAEEELENGFTSDPLLRDVKPPLSSTSVYNSGQYRRET